MELYDLKDNPQNNIFNYKEFVINKKNQNESEKQIDSKIDEILNDNDILQLTSYQDFISKFINPNTQFNRMLLMWNTGSGKCFKKNTPIMLSSGNIKYIQNIKIGDTIMGTNGTIQTVLNLSRGKDIIYKISSKYSDDYYVNSTHILSFKSKYNIKVNVKKRSIIYLDSEFLIIREVKNILNSIDIYDVVTKIEIRNRYINIPILKYIKLSKQIKKYLTPYKEKLIINDLSNNLTDNLNDIYLKGISIVDRKICIRDEYKFSSINNRMYLLAGILDKSDNKFNEKENNKNFSYNNLYDCCKSSSYSSFDSEILESDYINDIKFLSRSLGFEFYKNKIIGKLSIIPTKKKFNDIPIKKTNISITQCKEDRYYGFELDGNNKFLLADFTVVHNSKGALSIANNFKELYEQQRKILGINQYLKEDKHGSQYSTGSIFIMGFTSEIFKKELLSSSYFGIVTENEINEYKKENDKDKLKSLDIRYNKRINNSVYRFFGYKEFYNRLFISDNKTKKIDSYNTHEIIKMINEKTIKINRELLQSFKNSLIICDECHNLYNSLEENNWGLSIQIVLDYYDNINKGLVKCLFLSATPITNNPIEVISVLNLLSEVDNKVKKKDIFKGNQLKKYAELEIKNRLKGKISYIQSNDSEFFPSSSIVGNNTKINGIKLVSCPMSELHFKTYKEFSEKQNSELDKNYDLAHSQEIIFSNKVKSELKYYPISLSLENRYLIDYVIPSPIQKNKGLFNNTEIKKHFNNVKKDFEVQIESKNNYGFLLKGKFMKRDNIKNYSSKYYNMFNKIEDLVINKKGKIFIFHNYVNNSGIVFIQELFKENGIISENANVTSDTLCSICFKSLSSHNSSKNNHEFKAMRYVVVSGDINNNIIENSLTKFNSISNKHGDDYKIIIGSKAIREGFDLKCIRNVLIMHSPDNISTLMQIIGRAVRYKSHEALEQKLRHVDIYIFVSTIPIKSKTYIYSFEELLYQNKLNVYKIIQQIENIFLDVSINKLIDYDINSIYRNSLIHLEKNKTKQDISLNKFIDIKKFNLLTYNNYYMQHEINTIKTFIKRLFLEVSPVFNYTDLLKNVKSFPFNTHINTKILSEESFINALNDLLYVRNNLKFIHNDSITINTFIESLYDTSSSVFYDFNLNEVVIVQQNNYYFLVLLENYKKNIDIDIEEHNTIIEDTIIDLSKYSNKVIDKFEIDKNNFLKKYKYLLKKNNVDVEELLNTKILYNYSISYQNDMLNYLILNINEYPLFKVILGYYYLYNLLKTNISIIKKSPTNPLQSHLNNFLNFSKLIIHNHKLIEKNNSVNKSSNNLLIGFQQEINDYIKFKIKFTNKNKKTDRREEETGIVCLFKEKDEIISIAKQLNINIKKLRKTIICSQIEYKLLENDLIKNEKYFYNVSELSI